MNLYDYILSEFEYDREVASMFCSVFEYREEPKDKLLIKQGNHSHNVIFFENGLARTCYRKGSKDITHFFYGEGTFYLSTEVVFLERDNIFDIQTLEKCCMRVTQFDKLRQLADRNPKIYHFILKEFSRNIRKTNDKIYGHGAFDLGSTCRGRHSGRRDRMCGTRLSAGMGRACLR